MMLFKVRLFTFNRIAVASYCDIVNQSIIGAQIMEHRLEINNANIKVAFLPGVGGVWKL